MDEPQEVTEPTEFSRMAWANRIAAALGVPDASVLAPDLRIELERGELVVITATVRKTLRLKDAGDLIAQLAEAQRS